MAITLKSNGIKRELEVDGQAFVITAKDYYTLQVANNEEIDNFIALLTGEATIEPNLDDQADWQASIRSGINQF